MAGRALPRQADCSQRHPNLNHVGRFVVRPSASAVDKMSLKINLAVPTQQEFEDGASTSG